MACHDRCPLGRHCRLVCCPNCGYQVVDETKSGLASLFQRLWPATQRKKQSISAARSDATRPTVPLTHIPVGATVKIRSLEQMPSSRMVRLSTFGVVPGSEVEIRQRHPAHVVRIGQTDLALGKEILNQIWVNAPNA